MSFLSIATSIPSFTRRILAFSPASLFAASEPGVWLDPSDLTTLFQDSAGTTPVTAPGQSVGLVLDKSKGLGPELVTNGDFSSATNWLVSNGTIASGRLTLSTTGATDAAATQSVLTVSGRRYALTVTKVSSTTSGTGAQSSAFITVSNGGGGYDLGALPPGTYTFYPTVNFTGFTDIGLRVYNDTPTTTVFDNISVKELPGFHATQATAAARPTYQVDSNGRGYLSFDGVDDWLVTPTITPGIDKAQVFAGVRKLSDAASAILLETSVNASGSNGAVYITAPELAANGYAFLPKGTNNAGFIGAPLASYPAPITNVLTGLGDISGDRATLRVNGTQAAQSTSDQGTGNFLAYPLYIGRRGGATLSFNGRIYGLIVRFGANLTADQITQTETWMNSKTGAY